MDLRYRIARDPVIIHVIGSMQELRDSGFEEFIESNSETLAFDTETTGGNIYAPGFSIRLMQISNHNEAYVIQVEKDSRMGLVVRNALRQTGQVLIHGAGYDIPVMQKCVGGCDWLWQKVVDTQTMAHLIDSREIKEGGPGLKLEELTKLYVDPDVAASVKGSMTEIAKRYKTTKEKIFGLVDIDDEDYLLYAGMDPILTHRLHTVLAGKMYQSAYKLLPFERDVQRICAGMEKRGLLLDVEYTEKLAQELTEAEDEASLQALGIFLVESVNAAEEVAFGFERLGHPVHGRTSTGKPKVDKEFLEQYLVWEDKDDDVLAVPEFGSPNHLAHAIYTAKKARKWRTTWLENFLNNRDDNNRCHPSIHTLRARTARMSITGIPAQTLPSGDWTVRRCFIADPGNTMFSVDFANQELRVLAALSRDEMMQKAFRDGLDLHQITADGAGVSRKVGKMTNFLTAYGGGAGALASQAGISFPEAKRIVGAFKETYPGFAVWSDATAKEAENHGYVYTYTGRRIKVDHDRSYSATNYKIQSLSRDVTCQGLIELDRKGLIEYINLPIHDEVLGQAPVGDVNEIVSEIHEAMEMDLLGVHIATDYEICGPSWGHKYMKESQ